MDREAIKELGQDIALGIPLPTAARPIMVR